MKHFITILLLCVGIAISADAQTFTQRIQKSAKGQGTVTIHQDAAIDELVNGPVISTPKNVVKPTVNTQLQPKKPAASQKADDKQLKAEAKQQKADAKQQKAEAKQQKAEAKQQKTEVKQQLEVQDQKETTSDSEEQTTKHTYKTTGYRIQVFAGGNTRRDRQRAEQAGNSLRSLFPGEEVYVHFYSPRWICRLGNYRSYEEAREKLHEVRKMGYDAATIVKGKITVSQ